MEIIGLDKLNAQIRKIANVSPKACLAGALTLQKYSMENAPVKTGFLRNSHSSNETKDGAEMVVSAEYAIPVEYGTENMAAQPYVRPAIEAHQDAIVKAIGKQVEKEIQSKL